MPFYIRLFRYNLDTIAISQSFGVRVKECNFPRFRYQRSDNKESLESDIFLWPFKRTLTIQPGQCHLEACFFAIYGRRRRLSTSVKIICFDMGMKKMLLVYPKRWISKFLGSFPYFCVVRISWKVQQNIFQRISHKKNWLMMQWFLFQN